MNLSLLDFSGELMVVSQFTLLASLKKGRRPSFEEAANPEDARHLYHLFIEEAKKRGVKVQSGEFGEMMTVEISNWGPVTFVIDSL